MYAIRRADDNAPILQMVMVTYLESQAYSGCLWIS